LNRDIPNEIQSRERRLREFLARLKGQWHRWLSVHFWRDPNGNQRILYVNRNPSNRKLNLNYPDNRFNDNCVLAGVRRATLFISASRPANPGRCRYLLDPAAELLARLFERLGEHDIFLVIKCPDLPGGLQEEFEEVELADSFL
jgi:hypothetical protein